MVLPEETQELIRSLWKSRDDTSPWRVEKDQEPESIDAAGEEGQERITEHLGRWITARATIGGNGNVAGGIITYSLTVRYRGQEFRAVHRILLHALAEVARTIITIDVRLKAPKGAPATWLPGDEPQKEKETA